MNSDKELEGDAINFEDAPSFSNGSQIRTYLSSFAATDEYMVFFGTPAAVKQ